MYHVKSFPNSSVLFIICTKSNGSKYYYIILIIQFLHTVKGFQVLLFNTINSILHYWFVCTQLKGQTVLFDP